MAKDKDRAVNPAQAQRKAEKAKALKKSKASVQAQRSERLARRNPERLQRQIDELKALQENQNGELRPKDKQALEQLEREVKGIRKARETLGDKAPSFGRPRRDDDGGGAGRGVGGENPNFSSLGKRRRGSRDALHRGDGESDGSATTDEDVRNIPMPRDTPPPVPPRHTRNGRGQEQVTKQTQDEDSVPTVPEKPVQPRQESKTIYTAAPVMRDFRKEAARFVPAAVAAKRKQPQTAKLAEATMEDASGAAREAAKEEAFATVAANGAEQDLDTNADDLLRKEEAAFEREIAEEEERERLKQEGLNDMMEAAAEGIREEEVNAVVEESEMQRLKEEAMNEAQHVAEEAKQEAEYRIMAEGGTPEKRLRYVEIEEVEDEDA